MEKFYKFGRKSSYFLIELRGNYGVYFFLVCMFQVSHARGQVSHVMCHVSHIYYTPSGERSRPGWVLAFLFTFARTYRVRKIQPIAAGYYNLLLHYELYTQGQENGSNFSLKHAISYYWDYTGICTLKVRKTETTFHSIGPLGRCFL